MCDWEGQRPDKEYEIAQEGRIGVVNDHGRSPARR